MNPDIAAALITCAAGIGAVIWQIGAKRNDDKLALQLGRLDKQLSDLYRPLYALDKSGLEHWFAFCRDFSNDPKHREFFPCDTNVPEFPPPNPRQLKAYRSWMEKVFMPTQTRMEEVIVKEKQSLLLSRRKKGVDEKELEEKIGQKTKKITESGKQATDRSRRTLPESDTTSRR